MSDYYFDNHHRCETLAEFNFYVGDDDEEDIDDEDNYIYCFCSRVFIRDGIKTYFVDKEYVSESDVEVLRDSQSQDWDDHSHVHFSLDTSYKVKCERDEGASCYCSASHTDNCCSTDEHDPHNHGTHSHALQPSDSGADLTYQDYHSDTHDKLERMDQDFDTDTHENYNSEDTWDKFWAVNGERLIWASWIKKYSDYINPAYLGENNDLLMDENNIPKQHSVDEIYRKQTEFTQKVEDDEMRERKFSYDSKVNPYKKTTTNPNQQQEKIDRNNELNKDDVWLPIGRRRSCSEQDRILSPRTLAGTDSMTNVTKLTISSYDVTSSHVTSDSTPTDDYSVSSSTSDDPSNDQTRIANIDDKYENLDLIPSEELDTEQYWQFLWKKHFGEQYALHLANFTQHHHIENNNEMPEINIEVVPDQPAKVEEKILDIECENSEGNSQEMPTVIEIQNQVDDITLDDKAKTRRKNKKASRKYISSVGVLLQNLLKEENNKSACEPVDAGDDHMKNEDKPMPAVDGSTETANVNKSVNNSNINSYSYDDGDDDPPEEKSVSLKRSHELEDDEQDKIKSTFQMMGFCVDPENLPKGELIYRKRKAKLRPPRYKKFTSGKKTYFDEDGNPYSMEQQTKDSQDEREMQTDDDCTEVKSEIDKTENVIHKQENKSELINCNTQDNTVQEKTEQNPDCDKQESKLQNKKDIPDCNKLDCELQEKQSVPDLLQENELQDKPEQIVCDRQDYIEEDKVIEAANVPLPDDDEEKDKEECEESQVTQQVESKRRRRNKRYSKLEEEVDVSEMPEELKNDPKMYKYWKKRHSLFHRFDEGIRLDAESWFSVTPESVATHIARKYPHDVVLDAFCGAGGNTIQFAHTAAKVIAIDIDPHKIELARHNATVYGVADRITFIVGDFFDLAHTIKADMVFLSPPWGGPNYSDNVTYDLETMLEPRPASELMRAAQTISHNITLYLPRNSRPDQILSLAKEVRGSVEVEQSFLDRRFVAITAYYYQNY